MENLNYKPRIADQKVEAYLRTFGAVCIEGPKWCGKTWTSSYHCASAVYLADPAGNFQNRQLAQLSPETILSGEFPRLIDEWQEVPPIWDPDRFERNRKEVCKPSDVANSRHLIFFAKFPLDTRKKQSYNNNIRDKCPI